MTAANVVPFKKPQSCLAVRVIIDNHSPLREGDLVAWQFREGETVMFNRWWGPTGRDGNGRYVPKGSIEEHFLLDHFKYKASDLTGHGLRILGKVFGGIPPVETVRL